MPYFDEVVISDYGGGNPRRLPVVAVNAAWELNNVGAFSAFTRIEDLRDAGCGGELKGSWLQWHHRTAGDWGGVIVGRPIDNGVAEIVGEGWASLMRHHALGDWDRPVPGPPAGLARRGVMGPKTDEPSFITLAAADESGTPVASRAGGQDMLDDFLPELVDSGLEWYVDPDRVLHLGTRLGNDYSAQVRLTEGHEIVESTFSDDAYTALDVEQFHVAIPQQMSYDPTWPPSLAAGALTLMSAQGVETLAGVQPLAGHHRHKKRKKWKDPGLVPAPEPPPAPPPPVPTPTPPPPPPPPRPVFVIPQQASYVQRMQVRSVPAELTVCDHRNAFAHTQVGDIVSIVVESAAFSGTFRVLSRGLDMSQDVMILAGEAIPSWVPQRAERRHYTSRKYRRW